MEYVYKNKYLEVTYDATHHLMINTWLPECKYMTDVDYKAQMMEYIERVERYRPQISLGDTIHFFYTITPDIQDWTNAEFMTSFIIAGVKKQEFLVSKDLFSQVSVEQTMDDKQHLNAFQLRYFESKDEALTWLNHS